MYHKHSLHDSTVHLPIIENFTESEYFSKRHKVLNPLKKKMIAFSKET